MSKSDREKLAQWKREITQNSTPAPRPPRRKANRAVVSLAIIVVLLAALLGVAGRILLRADVRAVLLPTPTPFPVTAERALSIAGLFCEERDHLIKWHGFHPAITHWHNASVDGQAIPIYDVDLQITSFIIAIARDNKEAGYIEVSADGEIVKADTEKPHLLYRGGFPRCEGVIVFEGLSYLCYDGNLPAPTPTPTASMLAAAPRKIADGASYGLGAIIVVIPFLLIVVWITKRP